MNKLLPLLIGVLLLLCGQRAQAEKQHFISVTFTNHSGYNVAYFLNGGAGREARLPAGATKNWQMSVDRGVPPTVSIHQVNGPDMVFSVSNGGRYVFRTNRNGKIINAFE